MREGYDVYVTFDMEFWFWSTAQDTPGRRSKSKIIQTSTL
jgi:hypothetical protein